MELQVGKYEGDPNFTALTFWTIVLLLALLYVFANPTHLSKEPTFQAGQ